VRLLSSRSAEHSAKRRGAGLLVAAIVGVLLASRPSARAHDVITTKLTFSRDISRIFERRCLGCHGGASSLPLVNYAQVRPWAVDIKDQVLSRSMPPWGAVKGFGKLNPDQGLSEEEILIIAGWVVGGAPEGDPALLPKTRPTAQSEPAPVTADALVVSTRSVLTKDILANGIRPLADTEIGSARLIARLPNGHVEPLVWLYHFPAAAQRTFFFREPLRFPVGTVLEASAPLRFAVVVNRIEQPKALSPGS
jgi:mono/diheme cytochrome c family protein